MPFLPNATWKIKDNKFLEYKRRIHQGTEVAATRLQNRMVNRARQVASERTLSGKMSDSIRGRVELTERGVVVAVEDPVFYAHFQDKGTKRGVTPLLFLEAGLREGIEHAGAEMAAALGAVKV